MKSNQTVSMTNIAIFVALAFPLGLRAQQIQHQNNKHHHYQFIDLGTFGGPTSVNPGIYPALNNSGTVIGIADTSTPDPFYPNFNPLIEVLRRRTMPWSHEIGAPSQK